MRRVALAAVVVLVVALLAGCAPSAVPPAKGEDVAGFWQGLWHGFIVLFTFLVSLFNPSVGIYEVNNSGGWYDFGYVLGLMAFFGGGSGGAAAGSRGR